ncbi:MFS transporter [Streptomyces sp. NPDC017520]|uniref:MFS transporter n=1 Tax=Streptomyces sp. NPDC017520 TaxID=3364998 RepID=UPI0037A90F70
MSTQTPVTVADSPGTFAPLRHQPFRMLIGARVLSMLGDSVAPLALAFAVLDLTESVTSLGLVVAGRTVFYIIFVLLGGVIADRLPRHFVMVGSSVLAGLSQGAAAVLFLTHTATIPVLLVVVSINGMAAALSQPASAAIISQTVPTGVLKQANALSYMATNAVGIASTAFAGVLIGFLGSGWVVAIDAASFFIAAVFFALIKIPDTAASAADGEAEERVGLLVGLREGWREFIGRTWLWVLVVGSMFYNAAYTGGIAVLAPQFADITIGRQAWGVVIATPMLGVIVGAFLAGRLRPQRLLAWGTAALAGVALIPLGLVFWPNAYALIGAAFLAGIGIGQFNVAWETTMQSHIAPGMLARVYSYDMLGSFLAMPIGELAAGPAANAFGLRSAMFGVGLIMVLSVAAMLMAPSVWRIKHVTGAERSGPEESGKDARESVPDLKSDPVH